MSIVTFMDALKFVLFKSDANEESYSAMEGDVFDLLVFKLGKVNYNYPITNNLVNNAYLHTIGFIANGSKVYDDMEEYELIFSLLFKVSTITPTYCE